MEVNDGDVRAVKRRGPKPKHPEGFKEFHLKFSGDLLAHIQQIAGDGNYQFYFDELVKRDIELQFEASMRNIDFEQVKQYINDQYAIAYPDPSYRPYQALEVRETPDEMASTYPLQVLIAGYTDTPTEPSWSYLTKAEIRKMMRVIEEREKQEKGRE